MAEGIHALTVPKWGIEMQEGTIVGWHAEEGAELSRNQELVDIETDKIVNTVESPWAGVLRRRLAKEGDTLKVGELLGVIAGADVDEGDVDRFVTGFTPVDASFGFEDKVPAQESVTGSIIATETQAEDGGKVRVSPAAARRARELGVDISRVQGSGRGGRISSEDVEQYHASQGATAATDAGDYESLPFSATRRTIARRLVEAKQQIPHFYLAMDIEMDAALALRDSLNAGGAGKVSVNDLVLRATILALQEVPDCNVQVMADEVRRFRSVNLAFAVATERGLMTPVIARAQTLSLSELARRARELGLAARQGELTREQVEHGTFTVSNLGMLGISAFQAVINPPQGAILAVGATRAVVVPDAGGATRVAQVMQCNLSCDHRAIDGALGARFLSAFRSALEAAEGLAP